VPPDQVEEKQEKTIQTAKGPKTFPVKARAKPKAVTPPRNDDTAAAADQDEGEESSSFGIIGAVLGLVAGGAIILAVHLVGSRNSATGAESEAR